MITVDTSFKGDHNPVEALFPLHHPEKRDVCVLLLSTTFFWTQIIWELNFKEKGSKISSKLKSLIHSLTPYLMSFDVFDVFDVFDDCVWWLLMCLLCLLYLMCLMTLCLMCLMTVFDVFQKFITVFDDRCLTCVIWKHKKTHRNTSKHPKTHPKHTQTHQNTLKTSKHIKMHPNTSKHIKTHQITPKFIITHVLYYRPTFSHRHVILDFCVRLFSFFCSLLINRICYRHGFLERMDVWSFGSLNSLWVKFDDISARKLRFISHFWGFIVNGSCFPLCLD